MVLAGLIFLQLDGIRSLHMIDNGKLGIENISARPNLLNGVVGPVDIQLADYPTP